MMRFVFVAVACLGILVGGQTPVSAATSRPNPCEFKARAWALTQRAANYLADADKMSFDQAEAKYMKFNFQFLNDPNGKVVPQRQRDALSYDLYQVVASVEFGIRDRDFAHDRASYQKMLTQARHRLRDAWRRLKTFPCGKHT